MQHYRQMVAAESISLTRTTDTTYRRRINDLIRRSRAVRTDSLARLMVALETAPDSIKWRVRRAYGCEDLYLMMAHGYAARSRAVYRMIDSLYRTGFDATRTDERLSRIKGPPFIIDHQTCGDAVFALPKIPDSLAFEPAQPPQRRR
jgi:hypothetical protein